ncbi:MAG: glycoside hydrolase family 88 protein [Clostridia bacterium]|nr:glycoside hydrolase family 88 protein [Clostridia bacterium]
MIDRKLLKSKLDLVIQKLMNLDAPDMGMDKDTPFEQQMKGLVARDFGIREWDWPQGVGLYGLLQLQRARGNQEYDPFLLNWMEENFRIGQPSANINTTAPYLTLFELTERYEMPEWEQICRARAEFLINYLPKTKEGGFEHLTSALGDRNGVWRHPDQLWVDTLFMAVLFLGKMGRRYGNEAWIQASVYQFLLHIRYLCDVKTGLLYHGWTFEENNHFGGIFWNRGDSWFTYGAVAYLDAMGDSIGEADRRTILSAWRAQVDSLIRLQDEGGLWHTILDKPSSYIETSGSAAIAAGILYGIRCGYLDASYVPAAEKAVSALLDYIDDNGVVGNVSAGTAVGMNAEHYEKIMIRPMAYGQSLTALALTEALYL